MRGEARSSGAFRGMPPAAPRPAACEQNVGSRLVHTAIATGPVRLAELELLDLPGGRPIQHLPELDRRRTLEVGQPTPAEVDQLALADAGAAAEHHESLDGLPPLLVWDADHGRLGDRGVLEQAILHVDGRD